ncbi:MAG: hypothetical protein EZS28_018552 [Streblomastix strix]|uniref:Uncharacterized protein n=1 Tax=Streblomastix strix TaxID=222440 RepID=A0A5J4VUB6_9EUKA|nr:MAG: hypothetical protein EZS28_018551 [Streblomastix strix]KAA6385923.1 MAG: hypothetical protein EZS28_018552 [Streblomastix strix]
MVDKENREQPTRVIDQQDNNMHVNNRRITTGLESNTDIREPDITDITRLLERKRSRNDKQCQRNKSYLLWATPYRASLQEDAGSGNLDTFRRHNISLLYWEMESEGIPDRKNKASILSGEETYTSDHNNPLPRKTELNNRFTLETMRIERLLTEGRNDLNDLQDMELHATDRHIRNTVQQTNQQLCNLNINDLGTRIHNAFNYKWSKVKLYIHPPISVLNSVLQKMKQDKAQVIVIAPIWPGQSWYTKLKNLSIKFLFLGQADKILEMGQRMKDKDQKLPPGNVGAFLLDLSQTLGETYY